ncbi:cupin domain-containing protein [Halalkalirubrum salinum]|uniref:cupin domain-containing protein n=1 Tax=Halalkalirubrum salinum TaxID=2563889 RepID=UPI0010FB491A|nr:cupin domain-containing protein [Halalkalirubrum salinum]
MSYRKVNYEDVDRVSGAMHFLREPLDSEQVGVTIAKCEPGWIGQRHDHTDNGHEEIYVLVDGQATVVVDEVDVAMNQGDALWIDSTADRQIRNGDAESTFVLVSAPELVNESDAGSEKWSLTGFQG